MPKLVNVKSRRVFLTCPTCNKIFSKWPCDITKSNFCSKKCMRHREDIKKLLSKKFSIQRKSNEYKINHSISCKEGNTGKYKRSKSHCEKISKRMKERIFTEQHKNKLSDSLKKRWEDGDLRKRISLFRRSEVNRRKNLSKEEKSERRSGKNNPNWKGGVSPLRQIIRGSFAIKKWRISIFKRDYYTCQMPNCGLRGVILNAHHIKTFSKYPELRFNISNGITLCVNCHKKTKRKEDKFEKLFIEILKCNSAPTK